MSCYKLHGGDQICPLKSLRHRYYDGHSCIWDTGVYLSEVQWSILVGHLVYWWIKKDIWYNSTVLEDTWDRQSLLSSDSKYMISPCRRGDARMTNWWTVPDWRSPPGEVQHSSRVWRESVTQAGYILHFTSPTHYTSELHSTIGLVEPNTVFTTARCLLWSGSFCVGCISWIVSCDCNALQTLQNALQM